MKLREQRRAELQAALAYLDREITTPALDVNALRPQINALLANWRGLAAKLVGRITFSPDPEAGPGVIRLRGEGTLAPILGLLKLQVVQGWVAATGFEPVFES